MNHVFLLWKMPGFLPLIRDHITRIFSGFAAVDDFFPFPPDEDKFNAACKVIDNWIRNHALPCLRRRIRERKAANSIQRIVRGYLSRKELITDIRFAVEMHQDEIEYIELLLRRGVELIRILPDAKEIILFQLNDSGRNAHLKLYTSFHSRNSYKFTVCALMDIAEVRDVSPATLQLITCNHDCPTLNFAVDTDVTREALVYALRMIIDKNLNKIDIEARGRKPWYLLPYPAVYHTKVLPSEFTSVLALIYRHFSAGIAMTLCTKHRLESYILRIADDLQTVLIGQYSLPAHCCFSPNDNSFRQHFIIKMSEIVEVRTGQHSPLLRKMILMCKDKCLAIVTEHRTYECILESVQARDMTTRVLRVLINVQRAANTHCLQKQKQVNC